MRETEEMIEVKELRDREDDRPQKETETKEEIQQ